MTFESCPDIGDVNLVCIANLQIVFGIKKYERFVEFKLCISLYVRRTDFVGLWKCTDAVLEATELASGSMQF